MKKFFMLLLVLTFVCSSALSEDLLSKKLGDLSLDELMIINRNIQLRIFEKEATINGVTVPAGLYVVGQDLPSGTYRVVFNSVRDTDYCSFLAVNESESFGFTTILGFSGSPEIGKIELSKNTHITITGGELVFFTYTGLFH